MFDACTTGDTAHIDTIFKFLPHTRQQEQYVDLSTGWTINGRLLEFRPAVGDYVAACSEAPFTDKAVSP